MSDAKYLSRRGIEIRMPEAGHRCFFCQDKIMKGTKTYRFANIDPKEVRIGYLHAHVSCTDKKCKGPNETAATVSEISDFGILRFWEWMEALMARRHGNAGNLSAS